MSSLDPARAAELLDRARTVRILVVGDLMLDRYVSGRVERVSPEAPVPVVVVEEERSQLGGAANVAANVVALGAACGVVGCLGDDPEGDHLLRAMETAGIDGSGVVRTPSRPTTVKTRVHAKPQQIVRFDREVVEDVDARSVSAVAESIRLRSEVADALVVQDYDKGVLTADVIRCSLDAADRSGIPLVVDPKRRSFFDYPGATVFKPNRRELEDALGEAVQPEEAEWMEAVRKRLGCRHLLVTLGDRGMALRTESGESTLLAAAASEVYDVSGAGDTVSAALAVALAAGATPSEAAALANHAAAAEVRRPGVRTVTPEEITAHVRVRSL